MTLYKLYNRLMQIDEDIYALNRQLYDLKVVYDSQWSGRKQLTRQNKLAAQAGWRKWLIFTAGPVMAQIKELVLEHNRVSAEIEGAKRAS